MRSIKVVISPEVNVDGVVKRVYPSMNACARELGLQESHISECCAGKLKQHKGFYFEKARDKE